MDKEFRDIDPFMYVDTLDYNDRFALSVFCKANTICEYYSYVDGYCGILYLNCNVQKSRRCKRIANTTMTYQSIVVYTNRPSYKMCIVNEVRRRTVYASLLKFITHLTNLHAVVLIRGGLRMLDDDIRSLVESYKENTSSANSPGTTLHPAQYSREDKRRFPYSKETYLAISKLHIILSNYINVSIPSMHPCRPDTVQSIPWTHNSTKHFCKMVSPVQAENVSFVRGAKDNDATRVGQMSQ